jgi:hypothetical protein
MDPFLNPFEGNGAVPAGIDTGPAIRASRSQDRFLFSENDCAIGTSRDAEFASFALYFMNNNRHNILFVYSLTNWQKAGGSVKVSI